MAGLKKKGVLASITSLTIIIYAFADWTQGMYFLGRCSRTWTIPLALFVLVVFEIGSHFILGSAWATILLFVISHVDKMTSAYHHTNPLVEKGSC
jgi:hypothetical protein